MELCLPFLPGDGNTQSVILWTLPLSLVPPPPCVLAGDKVETTFVTGELFSGGRMIFESSASKPISPRAHHSPTRRSSLFLPPLITPFLRAGGGLQLGHDSLCQSPLH
ncbi:hypothetical protein NQZ68_002138 [Dissostichus eleginoides]|nr:hypothetical protein NQZ68_002138 [Dissostichus eleginoides]